MVAAMSTTPTLETLLASSGLADKARQVDNNLVRLQWGSAFVLVGVSGTAIVAIAPLFREVPHGKELAFYKKLLEHNAYMGGMASFAIQPDGWVILHAGRALSGHSHSRRRAAHDVDAVARARGEQRCDQRARIHLMIVVREHAAAHRGGETRLEAAALA